MVLRLSVEQIRAERVPETPAQLSREGEDGAERPMMNRHIVDQSGAVEAEDGDSLEPSVQGLELPFEIAPTGRTHS
jgi:hypothetical protein